MDTEGEDMYDYTENVRRGIAFLDEYAPAGWRDRIDWSKVSIMSTDDCVAGQAFGPTIDDGGYRLSGWSQASDILWGLFTDDENTTYESGHYGFNYVWEDDESNQENLINTWKRELGVKV
jgi:hypothetical protein